MRLDRIIPPGWRKVTLTDVVEVNPSRELRNGTSAPFVEMADLDVRLGGIQSHSYRVYKGSGSRFANGDTIFGRITPCAENGKIAFVDILHDGCIAHGSTEFIVLGPMHDYIDPKFLFYLVGGDRIHSYAVSRMEGTSGRQRVPNRIFDEIVIPLPSLVEQRKIAAILNSIDRSIESTKAVIEQTRRTRVAVLQDSLTNGIPHRHTQHNVVKQVGRIPKSWNCTNLGTVAEVKQGIALGPHRRPHHHARPYLRVANVQLGSLDLGEVKMIEVTSKEAATYALQPNDILLVEGHANINELGRAALVTDGAAGVLYQNHLFRIRTNVARVHPVFLVNWINSEQGRNHFKLLGGTTSGLNTVGATSIRRMKIPLPSPEEQREIAALLDATDARLASERSHLDTLTMLKTALARALLTGKVRVRI